MKYEKCEFGYLDIDQLPDTDYQQMASSDVLKRLNDGWQIQSMTSVPSPYKFGKHGLLIIWVLPVKGIQWGSAIDGVAIKFP